jgi:uridine kinase
MMRDKVERKRTDEDIINQWKCITRKMHEIFVRPLKDDADIVIPWYKMNGVALEAIRSIVESLYKKNRNN